MRDRQHLYECAVQSCEADLDFAEKVYRKHRGRRFQFLREDFCGTAALACTWVLRREGNRALGVDLDRKTLDWGIEHNVKVLGEDSSRLELKQENVCSVFNPKADVTMALNFSYWVFKTRAEILAYFKAAHRSLKKDGVFVLDLFGGAEAMMESEEEREIDSDVCFDGTRVPEFDYEWDQAHFNPITNDFTCHIHFTLGDGTKIRRAFTYHWRFWTIPELRELLSEAGFASSEFYTDGWDDDEDDSDGIYLRRKRIENDGVWVGYVIGVK